MEIKTGGHFSFLLLGFMGYFLRLNIGFILTAHSNYLSNSQSDFLLNTHLNTSRKDAAIKNIMFTYI
ncbi:hypothetical protein BpHYR1_006163 [Brachionus plicatilis]|uniref:Uncharacterized protein n=1 Tax=Brachionus plicatilis TaxID=10195 RepID=A0A3M7PSC3_BRAPC|nr:hypothetical protein BpHYR1_006163 [Brachionus plicatilis]